jgi:E3 ubiquitin-protein ligase RNF139
MVWKKNQFSIPKHLSYSKFDQPNQLISKMALRTKMMALVDVFMRVPPLFILDEILKINLGIQLHLQTQSTTTTITASSAESGATTDDVINSTIANILDASHESGLGASEEDLYKYVSLSFIKFLLCLAGM